jgi:hypothetical protein
MEINDVPVKIISSSQAVVEQEETEIKRQGLKRKTEPHKSHNSAKRRKGKTQRETYNNKTKDIFEFLIYNLIHISRTYTLKNLKEQINIQQTK